MYNECLRFATKYVKENKNKIKYWFFKYLHAIALNICQQNLTMLKYVSTLGR